MTDFELGPLQKKWMAELRSGKHKQGHDVLKSFCGEYCCLGVAAEHVPGMPPKEGPKAYNGFYFGRSEAVLGAWRKLKLRGSEGQGSEKVRGRKSLAALNDNGASFEEIADIIEADPRNFFTGPV